MQHSECELKLFKHLIWLEFELDNSDVQDELEETWDELRMGYLDRELTGDVDYYPYVERIDDHLVYDFHDEDENINQELCDYFISLLDASGINHDGIDCGAINIYQPQR